MFMGIIYILKYQGKTLTGSLAHGRKLRVCPKAASAPGRVQGAGVRLGLWLVVISVFLFSQMFLIRWLYSILDYVSDCWDSLFHSNWYRLGVNES